jgi:hypothetical protein
MAKVNRKFRIINVTDDCFNLYSSVGDWLNLFSKYLKFKSDIINRCDYCDKVLAKTHQSNSIIIDAFNTRYDILVRSKMVTKVINVCSNVDVDLVE